MREIASCFLFLLLFTIDCSLTMFNSKNDNKYKLFAGYNIIDHQSKNRLQH